MPIEKILEKIVYADTDFWCARIYKVKPLVHCSCGRDYEVKEKFKNITDLERFSDKKYILCFAVRPTKCPACKDVSYLEHYIYIHKAQIGYDVKIVTDKVISTKK